MSIEGSVHGPRIEAIMMTAEWKARCTWWMYRYMAGKRVEGGTDTRDKPCRNRLDGCSIG